MNKVCKERTHLPPPLPTLFITSSLCLLLRTIDESWFLLLSFLMTSKNIPRTRRPNCREAVLLYYYAICTTFLLHRIAQLVEMLNLYRCKICHFHWKPELCAERKFWKERKAPHVCIWPIEDTWTEEVLGTRCTRRQDLFALRQVDMCWTEACAQRWVTLGWGPTGNTVSLGEPPHTDTYACTHTHTHTGSIHFYLVQHQFFKIANILQFFISITFCIVYL